MHILLVDNGSLEPAATLNLRETARLLGVKLGTTVEPVSALHSSGVEAALLGGIPAEILEPAINRRIDAGVTDFAIVPLYFGPSGFLTESIPEMISRLRRKTPAVKIVVAESIGADDRIAAILEAGIREHGENPAVIVVDHGSPTRAVTAVRDAIAGKLRGRLGDAARAVQAASMERRPGAAYEFNEPLLAAAFDRPEFHGGDIVVALMFFAPGRHAGPGGDIERICAAAERNYPAARIRRTAPIGAHPLLIDALADRARQVL